MIERSREEARHLLDEFRGDLWIGLQAVALGASADQIAERAAVLALGAGEIDGLEDFVDEGAVDRAAATLEPVAIVTGHVHTVHFRHRGRRGDARPLVAAGAQVVALEFAFGGGVAFGAVGCRDGAARRQTGIARHHPLAAQRRAAGGPGRRLRRRRRRNARRKPSGGLRDALNGRPYDRAGAAGREIIEAFVSDRPGRSRILFEIRQFAIVVADRGGPAEQQPAHRCRLSRLAVLPHRPVPRDITMLGAGHRDIGLPQVLATGLLMGLVDGVLARLRHRRRQVDAGVTFGTEQDRPFVAPVGGCPCVPSERQQHMAVLQAFARMDRLDAYGIGIALEALRTLLIGDLRFGAQPRGERGGTAAGAALLRMHQLEEMP